MSRRTALVLALVLLTTGAGFAGEALHVMENDEIKVEINDCEYPYDQIEYLQGVSNWIENLYHLKLAFWDGGQIWEYNTTTLPNGFDRLVEVESWTFGGADPHRWAHVRLGDHATSPSFTIDLSIVMEGDETKAIRSDFVVDMTALEPLRSSPKLYLYGDPKVSGSDWTNHSAYRRWRDLFYVCDTQTTPNLYFGLSSPTAHVTDGYPMHFYGHAYTGSYGTELLRGYMTAGQNFPGIANPTAGNQVAGWNWDLGAGTGDRSFTVYMGLGTGVRDLGNEIHAPVFVDGFDTGDLSVWSSASGE